MRALLLTGVAAGTLISGVVAASAADVRAPVRVVAPAPSWAGHYFGLSLGWVNARGSINDVNNEYGGGTNAGFQGVDPGNGFLLGGKLGYNFGAGGGHGLILGVEADVSGVFGEDATCGGTCATFSSGVAPGLSYNLHGLASLVGRLGWAVSNRSMFYGLAGIATGAVTTNAWNNTQQDGTQRLFTGWTAGLGLDMMMSNNVSFNLEGRYYDLGSKTFNNPANFPVGYHPTAFTLSIGAKHYF